ncbi:MAG TPA: 3-hydroxybutyryl-CoA dehydrogenase [Dehalococcoidia bacterium]|jgi:3-hydroxybutyryl-CoA dehydrogenase|nr:3-hydroxybutyryl-CoA dehydrogenase [Dehalococcoidia bacterium]
MEVKQVGVVGCGQMGGGITQVCAQSGYQVIVSEVNEELLNRGLAQINASLTKAVEKGKITEQDKEATLSRIKGTTDIKDFSGCDLVIEAAIENLELKKRIFAELDKTCPKHAILATNTSCLSIIDMAMATSRPDKVLGVHFFNPAPVMKLLEIVKTIATSDETLEIARTFGQSLGKTPVIAQDAPGFIVNRLMVPQLLNAIRMVEAGVATKEDIDTAMTLGLNHPLGPLGLADLVGLDTLYFIAEAIYAEFKDPQFAPPTLLKKMVTAGWLGRKTGKGFYEYK